MPNACLDLTQTVLVSEGKGAYDWQRLVDKLRSRTMCWRPPHFPPTVHYTEGRTLYKQILCIPVDGFSEKLRTILHLVQSPVRRKRGWVSESNDLGTPAYSKALKPAPNLTEETTVRCARRDTSALPSFFSLIDSPQAPSNPRLLCALRQSACCGLPGLAEVPDCLAYFAPDQSSHLVTETTGLSIHHTALRSHRSSLGG